MLLRPRNKDKRKPKSKEKLLKKRRSAKPKLPGNSKRNRRIREKRLRRKNVRKMS